MRTVVAAIAFNTFRETVRDKVLYNLLLFALGFALVSVVVSRWSMMQEEKILQDFGLAIITVFGLLIAVFIGIGLVYKEIDKRTIYTILAKPISRRQFLAGKFLGLLITLFVNFLFMAAGFIVIIWLFTGLFKLKLLLAVGMIFFQMAVMVSVALFFSTFTSPVVSAVLSLFIFLAGNFSADITILDPGVDNVVFLWILHKLYYCLPNFSLLNINTQVVHDLPLQFTAIAKGILHAIAYSGIVLMLAGVIFNRRSLK